jgi:hypothetical protein
MCARRIWGCDAVSRARCSVLPAMRSIVRYAASQNRDPLRVRMDPGSAAHRHWCVEDACKRTEGAALHPGNAARVRHCEERELRSNPFLSFCRTMDCFASLAMTGRERVPNCIRHARPCAGHPRLWRVSVGKTWMAGSSPAMTRKINRAHAPAIPARTSSPNPRPAQAKDNAG